MGDVADHPERDQDWDQAVRGESEFQRLDRNWSNLLQELRVVQTGVQLLTGFLLTLPFQPSFRGLPRSLHFVYLGTATASITATITLVAPVGMHRLLFRRRHLQLIVAVAHRQALVGLALLGVALCGVAALTFAVVVNTIAGIIAAAVAAALVLALWIALPLLARTRKPDDQTSRTTRDVR
ncbi:MAG: hypothetical protein HOQ24_16960 [Mycobacteriaceae bacterium]|nr:hypothetical protein [Mycobacteriaceae bacterium]